MTPSAGGEVNNSDKRFLKDGRKQGCHFSIGKPEGVLCIAEGFVTTASIHESTGHAVVAAFDAGNLLHVARALREKFPDLLLVLCADVDHNTTWGRLLHWKDNDGTPIHGLYHYPCCKMMVLNCAEYWLKKD